MNTVTIPTTPAEIAEAEGVTADACLKAAWALTELLNETCRQLEEFGEVFGSFAADKALAPVFRDAAGVAWAIDQFTGLQWGQLPYWANNGEHLVPTSNDE